MNTYYDFTPRPEQEIARPFIDYFFPTFRLGQLKSLPKLDPSKNGQGLVITQSDIVDKTKKKHENTFFVIPPRLVPGSPPVTTTQFDICKDGGLLKKILKKGEKWESTKNPDDVIVKYEARRFDGTLVAKSDKVEFIVKDGYCCFALPKSVKNIKKGEKVILTVKPQYGLGDKGSVPSKATLFYEVFLVSFLKESWEMNTKEKIEATRKKKTEGDELKFAEKFARASKKYEKALKFIEDDTSFSDKEKKNIRGLKYDCYMSNAKCKMMLHDNEELVKLRAKALEFKDKEVPIRVARPCRCTWTLRQRIQWQVEEAHRNYRNGIRNTITDNNGNRIHATVKKNTHIKT